MGVPSRETLDMPQTPTSRAIVEDIARKIHSGEWPPGTQLPSTRELAEIYDCAMTTVQRALLILDDRGLIIGRQGKGRWVADHPLTGS